ncbi:recombinase family protein [Pseudomonas tremae]|uniref:recombinase family protein n=1 Tax=Pseudomonas syringae group TaxID=136849 RepID=UPI0001AF453E|nr:MULTISPECIES: recombinase family protein [Pseudomonas syringae group]MCQ3018323.1 recombinase family protein [Pseudomonas tremae]QGL59215.1 recombinase family protein [Pseudomonas coronafaciens pv. oryzae str. 1_6]
MATFGYGRVSTSSQDSENQRLELAGAGWAIDYWFADTISGKSASSQRPAFKDLLSKIRDGETLLVAKLDRLGRDAIDVLQTVRDLGTRNIKVVVHQLGSTDLTSPAGKLLLSMLAAVAEMERDLLIERTQAGLSRARSEGRVLGRPPKLTPKQRSEITAALSKGASVSALSKLYGVSRATIAGVRVDQMLP